MTQNKRTLWTSLSGMMIITAIAGLTLLFPSCSVVFSASLSGSIYDKEKEERQDQNPGIADMKVYLYSSQEDRDNDWSRWRDHGISPEAGTTQSYYQVTNTNDQGNYSFNGYLWEDLFPEFGKTGDRRRVYLLMQHDDYGYQRNPDPIYVVSDVSTSVPAIILESLYERGTLAGTVENTNTAEPIGGVTVRVYIEEEGSYPTTPQYTLTTGEDGEYTREVSFLSPAAARITFELNNYLPDDTDADLRQADGTNADGNTIDGSFTPGDGTGTTYVDVNGNSEFDSGDVYLQTGNLSAGTNNNQNTASLKQTEFSETLNGKVVDGSDAGQNDVVVWLFLYEDDDDNEATPEVTTCEAGAAPDASATTTFRLEGDTPEPGYFSMANIQWSDEDYSGASSTKMVTVYLPTYDEGNAKAVDAGGPTGTQVEYAMKSATENFVKVVQ